MQLQSMQLHVLSRDDLPLHLSSHTMGRLDLGTHGRTVRRVVPGRPRRVDGRHGAAVDRVGPGADDLAAAVGRVGLRARVRRLPVARRPVGGPAGPAAHAARRPRRVHRGVRGRRSRRQRHAAGPHAFPQGRLGGVHRPRGPLDHHHSLRRGPGAQPRAEHLHRDRRERLLDGPGGRRAPDRARLALGVPAAGADRARAARRGPALPTARPRRHGDAADRSTSPAP